MAPGPTTSRRRHVHAADTRALACARVSLKLCFTRFSRFHCISRKCSEMWRTTKLIDCDVDTRTSSNHAWKFPHVIKSHNQNWRCPLDLFLNRRSVVGDGVVLIFFNYHFLTIDDFQLIVITIRWHWFLCACFIVGLCVLADNWSVKAKRRRTTGTGRMRYMKVVFRRFRSVAPSSHAPVHTLILHTDLLQTSAPRLIAPPFIMYYYLLI